MEIYFILLILLAVFTVWRGVCSFWLQKSSNILAPLSFPTAEIWSWTILIKYWHSYFYLFWWILGALFSTLTWCVMQNKQAATYFFNKQCLEEDSYIIVEDVTNVKCHILQEFTSYSNNAVKFEFLKSIWRELIWSAKESQLKLMVYW